MAGVVQQPLPDFLPDGLLPVEANGVGLLDFNDALAPAAGNAQDMLREFAKALAGARRSGIRWMDTGVV
ncbi:hypothetical protein [Bradyrhizobium sp. CB1650]|uniref:hypothetical protein n=1 Tax=Bradyrhizobium sp. CB1650 TaxID=3039153 RepID=UPI00325F9BF0